MAKSLILLGGTFDPIHLGHIKIAEKLYSMFGEPVTFLPTGIPPYKARPNISASNRLEMLNLIIANDDRFIINDIEIKKDDFCYTYKTLESLRQEYGNIPIHFVIGSDSLISLDQWDNWLELFRLTNFLIIKRPHYELSLMNNKVAYEFKQRQEKDFDLYRVNLAGKIFVVPFLPIDISSSMIRDKIKNKLEFESHLPVIITNYIKQHSLYV